MLVLINASAGGNISEQSINYLVHLTPKSTSKLIFKTAASISLGIKFNYFNLHRVSLLQRLVEGRKHAAHQNEKNV
jgi:hypothetical protein